MPDQVTLSENWPRLLGCYPIALLMKCKLFKYYFKLQNLNDTKIVKKVFNELVRLESLGLADCNCFSKTKTIFMELNAGKYVICEKGVNCNIKKCIKFVKSNCEHDFEKQCISNINSLLILRFYCHFKKNYGCNFT